MKVRNLFEAESLDPNFIVHNFEGSYWENCDHFILENWDREIDTMSPKQAQWLDKIVEDCVEKRIEG